ncbi:MAG: alanine/ornithine racemase family PLP-dependent enzyme [Bacilli bacterium]
MYPRITISLPKLIHNAQTLLQQCQENHITSCFLVGKVMAGNIQVLSPLATLGFSYLADSRIQNIKDFQDILLPKALMRIPMISEVKDVVTYSNLALVSELATIQALHDEAKRQGKVYEIIFLFDLGDLREGIFYTSPYLQIIAKVLTLPNIHLKGIGTNLTCFGGVIPDEKNMGQLIAIKHEIESVFQISLEIISGGNSSALYMINSLPKEVNNLRIGEALFLGRETAYGKSLTGFYQDAFMLEVEVVEVQEKPSYPIGTITQNSFGEVPQFEDSKTMRRAILAIGKQDVDYHHLIPMDLNIKLLASSSDHLIVQVVKGCCQVGDIIPFRLNYASLLQCMSSRYVEKKINQE